MLLNGSSRRRSFHMQRLRVESLEHRMLLSADIAFAEAVTYEVGLPATHSILLDVNLDGTLDVVTRGGEPRLLLSNGDTMFQPPRPTTLRSGWQIIAGDFDGDGEIDLASSGVDSSRVGKLRVATNEGVIDGTWTGFGPEIVTTIPAFLMGLTSGDFDADGDLDIAVGTNKDRIFVFINNGTVDDQWEGFSEPQEYVHPNFDFPAEVTAGDLDNDGDLDLLVSNYFGGDLSILLGAGDGRFADPVNYPVGSRGLGQLGVGDLDDDGDLDVIAPHFDSSLETGADRIALLRGGGDGTLAAVESIPAPGRLSTLIVKDLDKDGDLDMAGGFWNASSIVHFLKNDGHANFEEQESISSAGRISDLDAADLDGDGRSDLVVSHGFFEHAVSVHVNTTEVHSAPIDVPLPGDADMNGVFNQLDIILVLQAAKYLTGEPATFAEGDWNGDGLFDQLDIIAALGTGTYVTQSQASHRGSPHGGGGGNGGNVGGDVAGYIFSKLTLDDMNGSDANVIRSDGNGAYEHGMENTEIVIGRNRNMVFDFHDRENKPEERTIMFSGGIPTPVADNDECAALGNLDVMDLSPPNVPTIDPPTGLESAVSAKLTIGGEDYDDQLVGEIREAVATLTFSDESGQDWTVYFGDVDHLHPGGAIPAPCGSTIEVERLANLDLDGIPGPDDPGTSQWKISTEGVGYLYRDRDGPHADFEFYGIVGIPFSGIVESLTQEPIPSRSSEIEAT